MRQKNQIKRLYAGLPLVKEARTWAEIDLDALCYNYRTVAAHVKSLVEKREMPPIICVIKADAYGHGAGMVARALLDEGCRFFAVSCIEEAEEVRGVCRETGLDADILILGYTRPSLAKRLAQNDLIAALPSAEYAKNLAAAARGAGVCVRAHVKLDTGMNRLGFPAHSETEIGTAIHDIALLMQERGLAIEGMFTHFARADEDISTEASGLTAIQQNRFFAVKNGLSALGIKLMCHLNNSAGAIRLPGSMEDAVRVGISLYGCPPSDVLDTLPLQPVMRLVTMVSHVHALCAGETVSYGGTYTATEERRIATLPVGYADGFIRDYSGAFVRIKTKSGEAKVPIIGRICMDQCMVDITDTDAAVGDEVTLFGAYPEDIVQLARLAHTIPYEVLCLVSARVPRRYI